MNITINELMMKRVKFGEKQGTATAEEPIAVTEDSQKDLRALNFMGMKNLLSNPKLAQQLNIEGEEPQEVNAEGYVAPFSSNIAFQSKGKELKQVFNTVMNNKYVVRTGTVLPGAAVVGATLVQTGCINIEDKRPPVEITINNHNEANAQLLAAFETLNANMITLISLMQENNADNKKLIQLVTEMSLKQNQIYMAVLNNQMTLEDGFAKLFEYYIISNAQREVIIDLLVDAGKDRDEMKALFNSFIAQYNLDSSKAAELWQKIQELLGDILGEVKDIKSLLQTIVQQNKDKLDKLDKISDQINQTNIDSNAKFDELIASGKVNKDELIAQLKALGFTITQIQMMTAGQITAAINAQTQVTRKINDKLSKILEELIAGRISQEQANEEFKAILGGIANDVKALRQTVEEIKKEFANKLKEIIKNQKISIAEQREANRGISTIVGQNWKMLAEINEFEAQVAEANIATNATIEEAAEKLSMKFDELVELAVSMGIAREIATNMRFGALMDEIKKIKNATIAQNVTLNNILTELQKDNLSDAEIRALLKQALALLEEMNNKMDIIVSTVTETYKLLKTGFKNIGQLLGKLHKDNKIIISDLGNIKNETKNIRANLVSIRGDLAEIKTAIENGEEIDYAKLAEIIEGAENMTRTQIVAAIKEFEANQLAAMEANTAKIDEGVQILKDLKGVINNLDISALLAKGDEIKNAIINGDENITALVNEFKNEVNAKLTEVVNELKSIGKDVKTGNSRITLVNNTLTGMAGDAKKLLEYAQSIDGNTANINTVVTNAAVSLDNIERLQTREATYLENLDKTTDEINSKLDKYKPMTPAELDSILYNHDRDNYNNYTNYWNGFGLDKTLPNIDAYLQRIDNNVDTLKGNSNEIKTLTKEIRDKLNLLPSLTPGSQDYTQLLNEILEAIKNLKFLCECNCSCNGGGENHEGTLDDLNNNARRL